MKIPATNVEEATNVPRKECALLAENMILETRRKIQTALSEKCSFSTFWFVKVPGIVVDQAAVTGG